MMSSRRPQPFQRLPRARSQIGIVLITLDTFSRRPNRPISSKPRGKTNMQSEAVRLSTRRSGSLSESAAQEMQGIQVQL